MALTDTKKAKEFMAGAPDIKLKGDLRPKQDMQMASMDENEREFMRLVEEFMERGFNQQEAIDAAREEFDKKAMAYGGRAQYGLGSLVKSIKKGVKGIVKGVGKVAKSPLGLAAIGLGINQFGIPGIGGKGFLGNLFTKGGTLSSLLNLSGKGTAMDALKVGGAGAVITGLLANMESPRS